MLSPAIRKALEAIRSHINDCDAPTIKSKQAFYKLNLDKLLELKSATDSQAAEWFCDQLELCEYLRSSTLADTLKTIEQAIAKPLDEEDSATAKAVESKEVKEEKGTKPQPTNPADILSLIDPKEIAAAEKRLSEEKAHDLADRLGTAARNSDLAMMCAILNRGAIPDSTALTKATSNSNIEAALLLLQMGCESQPIDLEWIIFNLTHTNIHLVPTLIAEMRKKRDDLFPSDAAEWAYDGRADLLKEIKKSRFIRDSSDFVPLHYACASGQLAAVKTLCSIHKFYNPNTSLDIKGKADITPLMLAVAANHLDVAKYLIEECQCDVNARTSKGISVLMLAYSIPMMEYLISKDAAIWQSQGATALGTIVSGGLISLKKYDSTIDFLKTVNFVLDRQPDAKARTDMINFRNPNGYTYLYLEIARQPYPFIKPIEDAAHKFKFKEFLVQHGADVNIPDNEGQTPLHVAVENGDKENILFLLEHKADINNPDNIGNTPLFYAKTPEIAELLLKSGADINAENKRGENVLHPTRDAAMVKVFAKYGANFNAKSEYGRTPLQALIHRCGLKHEQHQLLWILIKNTIVDQETLDIVLRNKYDGTLAMLFFYQSMRLGQLKETIQLKEYLKEKKEHTSHQRAFINSIHAILAEATGKQKEADHYLNELTKTITEPVSINALAMIFQFRAEKCGFPKAQNIQNLESKLEAKSLPPVILDYTAMSHHLHKCLLFVTRLPEEGRNLFCAYLIVKINQLLENDPHTPEQRIQFEALKKRDKEPLQKQLTDLSAETKQHTDKDRQQKIEVIKQLVALSSREQDALLNKLKQIQKQDSDKFILLKPLLFEVFKQIAPDAELSAEEHSVYANLLMGTQDINKLSGPERFVLALKHIKKAQLKSSDEAFLKDAKQMQNYLENALAEPTTSFATSGLTTFSPPAKATIKQLTTPAESKRPKV